MNTESKNSASVACTLSTVQFNSPRHGKNGSRLSQIKIPRKYLQELNVRHM